MKTHYSRRNPVVCLFAIVSRVVFVLSFRVCAADCAPPPAGLVSWWPAEGNANDMVGTNPGTLLSGITFGAGKVGSAFNFDGADDYVSVPNAPSLNFGPGQDFSFEAWIQPLPSSTSYDIMTIADKRNAPDTSRG